MSKYQKREFQVGPYWLSQRGPAFYRTWYRDGKTLRVSLKTADRAQAEKALTDFFIAENTGKPVEGRVLMKDVLDDYWTSHGQHTASSVNLKLQIEEWKKHFPEKTVSEATAYEAQEKFKGELIKRGLSASSVNKILAAGKAAVRLAWRKGTVPSVPPFTMLPIGGQKPMGYPIGPEDTSKLLLHSEGTLRLFILLLLGTLGRPGAVLDLCKSQSDFEFGLIDLNPPGRRQNKKRRPVVRMPDFLRLELEALPDGPLFIYRGKKVRSLRTRFRQARKAAGLRPDINAYSWRHGVAKFLRASGVDRWSVEGVLGHRAGTTDRYATVDPTYLKEVKAAIEAYHARTMAHLDALKSRPVPAMQRFTPKASQQRIRGRAKSLENGERAGIRTQDLAIKSRVLYR